MEKLELFKADPEFPGMRMSRFEVLNWGGYDSYVLPIEMDGKSLLLVGENRSGKTTLLDAMVTLLCKNPRFEQAVDSKNRKIWTYLVGKFRDLRDDDGYGMVYADGLRINKNTITILLAVFSDSKGNVYTIAQWFWMNGKNTKNFSRCSMIAPGDCSIHHNILFSDNPAFKDVRVDISEIRRRVKMIPGAVVYDNLGDYLSRLYEILRISEQSLNSITNTVSVNSIRNINEFICTRLDRKDLGKPLDDLLERCKKVQDVENSIARYEKKMAFLDPLTHVLGVSYKSAFGKEERLRDMLQHISPWLGMLKHTVAVKEHETATRELERYRIRYDDLKARRETIRKKIQGIHISMVQNGGNQKETYEQNIKIYTNELNVVNQRRNEFSQALDTVGDVMPTDVKSFISLQKRLADSSMEVSKELKQLEDTQITALLLEKSKLDEDKKKLRNVIDALRQQHGNIDTRLTIVRDRLVSALGLQQDTLPFVGELVDVRTEEREWEGALNKLLKPLATVILVPPAVADKVPALVEEMRRMKVAYELLDNTNAVDSEYISDDTDSVCGKIVLKKGALMTGWVRNTLLKRFGSYRCCKTIEEFNHATYGLTVTGQSKRIRSGAKDDVQPFNDARYYVLGFTNERKIEALEDEFDKTVDSLAKVEDGIEDMRARINQLRKMTVGYETLRKFPKWSELDGSSLEQEIRELKQRLDDFLNNNLTYRKLAEELANLQEENKFCDNEIESTSNKKNNVSGKIEMLKEVITETVSSSVPDDKAELLESYFHEQIRRLPSVNGFAEFFSSLQSQLHSSLDALHEEGGELVTAKNELENSMRKFLGEYPEHTDLLPSAAYLDDFDTLYKDLLSSEVKMKEEYEQMFAQDVLEYFLEFNNAVTVAERDIIERVERLNESLADVVFRKERGKNIYMRILMDAKKKGNVQEFKAALKEAITNIHTAESEFDTKKRPYINKVIEYLTACNVKFEKDRREEILDVRRWYDYSLRLNDEDGKQIAHYDSTGGDSTGGQKALTTFLLVVSQLQLFNLSGDSDDSFRFIMLDETNQNCDQATSDHILRLLKRFNFQAVYVRPDTNVRAITPYVGNIYKCYKDEARGEGVTNAYKIAHKIAE